MLDIKFFRENAKIIKRSEKARFKDVSVVDRILDYDGKWRDCLQKLNSLREKRNVLVKEVSDLKRAKKVADGEIKEMKVINQEIKELDVKSKEFLEKREELRYSVGALVHESVPIGEGEESNAIVRLVGKKPDFGFKPKSHVDLVELVNGANVTKAAELVGARFYYLMNDLVFLNIALLKFALDHLAQKGFQPMWTPFFLNGNAMKGAAELADFEQQLYKIEGEDLFLIATSEQTLASFHKDEILDEKALPLKYAGVSTCFRKEAGAHGKDTRGIFRVHQFEKIEQYVFCKPEESWQMHEEMIVNAEELLKKLGIHYRVVNIASGELNDSAAKKYDLEAWFPAQNQYRELVSASNCVDYQTRKLNVQYGKSGGNKEVAHSLNATAIATERAMCCILENYQLKDGTVEVPKALRPYMNNKKVIGK